MTGKYQLTVKLGNTHHVIRGDDKKLLKQTAEMWQGLLAPSGLSWERQDKGENTKLEDNMSITLEDTIEMMKKSGLKTDHLEEISMNSFEYKLVSLCLQYPPVTKDTFVDVHLALESAIFANIMAGTMGDKTSALAMVDIIYKSLIQRIISAPSLEDRLNQLRSTNER